MDEHQKLVSALSNALRKRGYQVIHEAGLPGQEPFEIGRHKPDIIAKDSSGLLLIGEAKTGLDIEEQRSKEQFLDFSSRIMSEGLLKGREIPLHIIIPQSYSVKLRQVLTSLGISHKIGNRIIIWTLG